MAKRSIVDVPTASIAVLTIASRWRFNKLQEPLIVLGAAILGLVIYPLVRL